MKKILLFISIIFVCEFLSTAQTPQAKPGTPVRPGAPAAPKGVPPYVLKKDYEVAVQEMQSRIQSALGSSSSARKEMHEKLGVVDTLNMKMQQVEEILNSANFKIANTSDSLKTARNSMEEFRKETEANIQSIKSENAMMMYFIYGLIGLCVLLPIIVLVVLSSKINKMKDTLTDTLKSSTDAMNSDIHKSLTQSKTELQSLKSSIEGEVYSVRAEMKVKMMDAKDEADAQFQTIINKLETKQDKIVKGGA